MLRHFFLKKSVHTAIIFVYNSKKEPLNDDKLIADAYRYLLTNPLEFSFVGHFMNSQDLPSGNVQTGFYNYVYNDGNEVFFDGFNEIKDVAGRFSSGSNGYDGKKTIRMYSCSLAKYGGAAEFSKLVPGATIWAATDDVKITQKKLKIFGVKTKYYSASIVNGGKWVKYKNGVRQ